MMEGADDGLRQQGSDIPGHGNGQTGSSPDAKRQRVMVEEVLQI